MKIKASQYRLTEIAANLEHDGLTSIEASLLGRLQDGALTAHIFFPPFAPRELPIPVTFWREVELIDFRVAPFQTVSRVGHQAAQAIEYSIQARFAFEIEETNLKKLSLAAQKQDPDLIPLEYTSELTKLGHIDVDAETFKWPAIAELCVGWSVALGETGYEQIVFVSNENYQDFARQCLPQEEEAKGKVGPKTSPKYEEMWKRAFLITFKELERVADDKSFSREHIARELEKWFKTDGDISLKDRRGKSTVRQRIDEAYKRFKA